MKKLALVLMSACVSSAAFAALVDNETSNDSIKGFQFTDVKTVKTTSVKDQNKTGTCWCFSGTSFIEDEIMRQGGDSLDLSEMFTVLKCYQDKADLHVRNYGKAQFAQGGSLVDVGYVLKKYGAVPEEVYAGLEYGENKHNHYEMTGVLTGMLNAVVKKPAKKISPVWRKAFDAVLQTYLGEEPKTFTYNGKTYTPQSFAASLPINPDDYETFTSFTHHPFYEKFILDVPDNWLHAQYMNVPLDELKAIVDNALENGYPVNWAADVSESGFKWAKGVALMPKGKDEGDMTGTELARWVKLSDRDRAAEKYNFDGPVEEEVITQEYRQEMYDGQETTDDHGMEIVGIATDQNGNRYYKVKNSWDTNQVYGGFIYVSEPYLLAKTVAIQVHKDAVPKTVSRKYAKK